MFSFFGGFTKNGFFNLFYLNLLFAVTYGVLASIFSDWLSTKISEKASSQNVLSLLFHCGLGLMIMGIGAVSAGLFYGVDLILKRRHVGWSPFIVAVVVVVATFIYLVN